jgi:hypothetical protein
MRGLGATDILCLWEIGEQLSPVERALALLHRGLPDAELEELFELRIGRRDALLFDLRDQTFGPKLRCCTECPRCSSRLEISLDSSALRFEPKAAPSADELHALQIENLHITFRLPNSRDLLQISQCATAEDAEVRLLSCCLHNVVRLDETENPEVISVSSLSEEVQARLSAELLRLDPQAVLNLALRCASCGHDWKSVLDIAVFFFTEVRAEAQRLAREITVLARAFGWSERDILAMTPRRRQLYLQEAEQ